MKLRKAVFYAGKWVKPSCMFVSVCTQYVHELLPGTVVCSERGETADPVAAST